MPYYTKNHILKQNNSHLEGLLSVLPKEGAPPNVVPPTPDPNVGALPNEGGEPNAGGAPNDGAAPKVGLPNVGFPPKVGFAPNVGALPNVGAGANRKSPQWLRM